VNELRSIEMLEQRAARKKAVHRALQNIGFKSDQEIADHVRCTLAQARKSVDELVEDGVIDRGQVPSTRRTGIRWFASLGER
jgi:predicted ArsR family transcriptional regulator